MKLYQAICLFYITTMIKKTINLEKINFEKMLQVLICIQGKALNAIVGANNVLFTLNRTNRSSVLLLCVVRFNMNKTLVLVSTSVMP